MVKRPVSLTWRFPKVADCAALNLTISIIQILWKTSPTTHLLCAVWLVYKLKFSHFHRWRNEEQGSYSKYLILWLFNGRARKDWTLGTVTLSSGLLRCPPSMDLDSSHPIPFHLSHSMNVSWAPIMPGTFLGAGDILVNQMDSGLSTTEYNFATPELRV